jgi:hypothetical protein
MMKAVHNRLGDPHTGGGYGTTKAKSSGLDYKTQDVYPYHEKQDELEDFDLDDEELFDKIAKRIDLSNIAKPATTGRTDRGTFTKMRLDLMEDASDTKIMTGMVPFPFSSLYEKFDGPALGGFSTNQAYKTGPGRNSFGTVRGWSQAPDTNPVGDKLTMFNIHDMIDPGVRSLAKSNLMIKIAQQDLD